MTRSAGGRNSTGASATMRPLLIATDASTTSLAVTTRPPLTIRSTARALIDRRRGPPHGPPPPPPPPQPPPAAPGAAGVARAGAPVPVGPPVRRHHPLLALRVRPARRG